MTTAWVSTHAFSYSSDFRVHKICPLTPSNLSPPFALRSLPRNLALFTLHKGGSWPGGCSPVMKWHNPGGEVGPFSLSPSLLCNFGTTAHHRSPDATRACRRSLSECRACHLRLSQLLSCTLLIQGTSLAYLALCVSQILQRQSDSLQPACVFPS